MTTTPERVQSSTIELFKTLYDIRHQKLTVYAELRDKILTYDYETMAALQTLQEALIVRKLEQEARTTPAWGVFFEHVDRREIRLPRSSNERVRRVRNIGTVIAHWGSDVLHYYGWDTMGNHAMRKIAACAKRFPNFCVDFVPLANYVMLDRQEIAASGYHRARRLTPIAGKSPLLKGDWEILSKVDDTPRRAYLKEGVAKGCFVSPEDIRSWGLSDGSVLVAGSKLHERQPYPYFQSFLLGQDSFGLLVQQVQTTTPPGNLPTPPTPGMPSDQNIQQATSANSAQEDLRRHIDASSPEPSNARSESPRGDRLTARSSAYESHGKGSSNCPGVCGNQNTFLSVTDPSDQVHDPDQNGQLEATSERHIRSEDTGRCQEEEDMSNQLPLPSQPRAAISKVLGADRPSTRSNGHYEHREGNYTETEAETNTDYDIHTTPSRDSADLLQPGDQTEGENGTASSTQLWADRLRRRNPYHEQRTPARKDKLPCQHGDIHQQDLALNMPKLPRPSSIEEILHNKYYDTIQKYVDKVASEANTSTPTDACLARAQWLTSDTPWARIYSPTPGRGRADSATDADVLYFTEKELEDKIDQGEVFAKPVVVVARYADENMHTVERFLDRLRDGYAEHTIDVQSVHAQDPEKMEIPAFLDMMATNPEDLNALNIRGIMDSYPPLFTFKKRYQLLKTLVARSKRELGKQLTERPTDIESCLSFGIFGTTGAFSGPHVDALAGTWVRNLTGIKLWMIVPHMSKSCWEDFQRCGSHWVSNGRQRLILLERGDTIFMPPGNTIIHAVHTMETALMEGGMLWDERNMLNTLRSLRWIADYQKVTNEAIPFQLPRILEGLGSMLKLEPDRFCRGHQRELIREAKALASLACEC